MTFKRLGALAFSFSALAPSAGNAQVPTYIADAVLSAPAPLNCAAPAIEVIHRNAASALVPPAQINEKIASCHTGFLPLASQWEACRQSEMTVHAPQRGQSIVQCAFNTRNTLDKSIFAMAGLLLVAASGAGAALTMRPRPTVQPRCAVSA